jgi:hypothetical protein
MSDFGYQIVEDAGRISAGLAELIGIVRTESG